MRPFSWQLMGDTHFRSRTPTPKKHPPPLETFLDLKSTLPFTQPLLLPFTLCLQSILSSSSYFKTHVSST